MKYVKKYNSFIKESKSIEIIDKDILDCFDIDQKYLVNISDTKDNSIRIDINLGEEFSLSGFNITPSFEINNKMENELDDAITNIEKKLKLKLDLIIITYEYEPGNDLNSEKSSISNWQRKLNNIKKDKVINIAIIFI